MVKHLVLLSLLFGHLVLPNQVLGNQVVNPEPQILFIVPDGDSNPFWNKSIKFMQAVAKSLNIGYESHLFSDLDRNRFLIVDAIRKQLVHPNKPHMIVTTFAFMAEKEILEMLEKQKTPFITINTTLTSRVIKEVGLPREKYKYWLGHIAPDDIQVGEQLAKYLIEHVPDTEKTMIGLGGLKIHSAGKLRTIGLNSAVINNEKLTFIQSVRTDWSVSDGKIKTKQLLERHDESNVNLIWAAGDALVEGALMAIDQFNHFHAGENIWLGGVDWRDNNIEYIKNGQQFVSLGGHFIEGGIATIMLYDYINGIDFKDDTGVIINTPLYPMTKSNVDKLAVNIKTAFWSKINFSLLSKKANPKLLHYDFSVPKLLAVEIDE